MSQDETNCQHAIASNRLIFRSVSSSYNLISKQRTLIEMFRCQIDDDFFSSITAYWMVWSGKIITQIKSCFNYGPSITSKKLFQIWKWDNVSHLIDELPNIFEVPVIYLGYFPYNNNGNSYWQLKPHKNTLLETQLNVLQKYFEQRVIYVFFKSNIRSSPYVNEVNPPGSLSRNWMRLIRRLKTNSS